MTRPTGLNWDAIRAPEPEGPKPKRERQGGQPGHGRARALTDEQIAEAVADYLRGENAYDVALGYGVTAMTVARWVRESGHQMRTSIESQRMDRERRTDS